MQLKVPLVTVLAAMLLSGTAAAQRRNPRTEDRFGSGARFSFFHPGIRALPLLRGHRIRQFPLRPAVTGLAPLFWADRWLFAASPGLAARRGVGLLSPGAFSDPYGWMNYENWSGFAYGAGGADVSNYNSGSFVQEWKSRDPLEERSDASLANSAVLSEGMQEDEVVRRLGLPLQRIQTGEAEVWKYSGYSLLFERNLLRGIR